MCKKELTVMFKTAILPDSRIVSAFLHISLLVAAGILITIFVVLKKKKANYI